jgi:hypothetical protein
MKRRKMGAPRGGAMMARSVKGKGQRGELKI